MKLQENIEKFLSGDLRWSIATNEKDKILPLIKRITGNKYYSRTERNGKFTHFYCKAIPHWEIRNSDLRQLKKIEKQLIKEELLKEKEILEKKLELLK